MSDTVDLTSVHRKYGMEASMWLLRHDLDWPIADDALRAEFMLKFQEIGNNTLLIEQITKEAIESFFTANKHVKKILNDNPSITSVVLKIR